MREDVTLTEVCPTFFKKRAAIFGGPPYGSQNFIRLNATWIIRSGYSCASGDTDKNFQLRAHERIDAVKKMQWFQAPRYNLTRLLSGIEFCSHDRIHFQPRYMVCKSAPSSRKLNMRLKRGFRRQMPNTRMHQTPAMPAAHFWP